MAKVIAYRKVQNDLKKKIIQEEYEIGDLLPSENKLAEQYGLSRMTIRNALRNLEIEGLIYRRQGKGSIVRYKQKTIELLSLRGFTEIMKDKEVSIDTEFTQKPKVVAWPKDFYWSLTDLEISEGCIYFSRVRMMRGKSIMYEDTYISHSYLNNFCNQPFINHSLFDTLLISHDVEIKDVSQKFRAIIASDEISKRLDLEISSPILEVIRKLSTNIDGLYIYSFVYCSTDEYAIET